MKLSVAQKEKKTKTKNNCDNLSEAEAYDLVALRERFRGIHGIMYCVVVYSSSLSMLNHSIFYDQCALSCASPQSTIFVLNLHFIMTCFEKGNFPNNDLLSLLIKQMHLWKDTRRQVQVLLSLLCSTEGANQTINRMPFVFTGRESLSDRLVLSNTPLKTNAKFAMFCKRTKSLICLFDYCASLCCNQLLAERKPVRWLFQRFQWEVKCYIIFKSFFSNMTVIVIFKVSQIKFRKRFPVPTQGCSKYEAKRGTPLG